jgi:hypothetical protein
MENVNPLLRLRYWWASYAPPLKRPSPPRFFVWLAFFAASGAAFLTLSREWFLAGFALMVVGNLVLHGFSPKKEYPAAKLTSRELFVAVAIVLVMVALGYFEVVSGFTLPSIPEPSPPVARVAIAIFWVAVIAFEWRRTFASKSVRSV